jgi:virulence factor
MSEARHLATLAEEAGRLLMVGFNRRYAEVYATAHDQFKQGRCNFCVAQKIIVE